MSLSLVNILDCYDVGMAPPVVEESLLLSQFASIHSALELNHLDDDWCREVLSRFKTELEKRLAGASVDNLDQQSIASVWRTYVETLRNLEDRYRFCHAATLLRDHESNPQMMSIQKATVLRYWLGNADFTESRLIEMSPEDILMLIADCEDMSKVVETAIVGTPKTMVWLTPYAGHTRTLTNQAKEANSVKQLESLATANALRNLLGLWANRGWMHGIAVVLKCSYNDLLDDEATKAKPPTIGDAAGYERFRHWPTPSGRDADVFRRGRTYNLSRSERRSDESNDGLPECITVPRPFSEVEKIVYLGRFGELPDEEGRERENALEYGRDLAGNMSLREIITSLSRRLGV